MITIYDRKWTDKATQADYSEKYLCQPINVEPYKAMIYKNDEGEYYADVEMPLEIILPNNKKHNISNWLSPFNVDSILMINTPRGEQPFRINRLESTSKCVKAKANHVSHDLKKHVIPTWYSGLYSLPNALSELWTRADINENYTYNYNVPSYKDYHTVTFSSTAEECETTDALQTAYRLAEIWGAKLVFDKFKILFLEPNPNLLSESVLKNGKNIQSIAKIEDWNDFCRKCIGIGYNNLRASYEEHREFYAPIRYDKIVYFSPSPNTNLEIESEILLDLKKQAEDYVSQHCIPKINYELSANLETNADIGDIITVKHDKLGIDIKTKVISTTYNALTNKYTNIEFGNFRPSVKGFATNTKKQMRKFDIRLKQGGL